MFKILALALALTTYSHSASKEIRDLYFEIHNDSLKSLFESKASLKKFEKFYCEVYWAGGKLEIVPVAKGLSKDLRNTLRQTCLRKAALAIPQGMDKYLASFEKAEVTSGWTIYRDATGVNDINEIMVKKNRNETRIIEKRPTGTTRVNYHYGKVRGERALKKVEHISYEGIQNVKAETKIKYVRISGFLLPQKALVSTTQNLVKKEMGKYTREVKETFYYKNHSVNDSKALLFFSKK